jgi:3-hydroxymyristoyl/3-hydroxydecanoyl-(acyl carrier protein) dehydratase
METRGGLNNNYTWRGPTRNHDAHVALDYSAIERILPHRYPFLLVDRVTEFEPDKRIVGIKNVSQNERYLARGRRAAGAAADDLTEAVAQVGAILILSSRQPGQADLLHGDRSRAVRRAVHPGDVVEIEAVVKRLRSESARSLAPRVSAARSCATAR